MRSETEQQPNSATKPQRVPAQTRDAERTKAAVLAAATREFADHGFGGARIELVAKRAKVNKQLIYYYFGSKEALYVAVLEETYARLRASEAALDVDALDPVQGITELALFNWRYHCQHPELISIVRTENLHKAKFLKRSERVRSLNSPLIATLEALLRRGVEQGVFRADVDAVQTYMTIAALSFYYLSNQWTLRVHFNLRPPEKDVLDAWGSHIVQVVLASLRPGAGASKTGGDDHEVRTLR
ncbi:MAG: TetR family transcriptional regulator [Rhizobiaceae bacterium]|nr:TetR family transcriptional regulator [Rhizobiaceae bacterium]